MVIDLSDAAVACWRTSHGFSLMYDPAGNAGLNVRISKPLQNDAWDRTKGSDIFHIREAGSNIVQKETIFLDF